jgi:hypothetical protein
MQSSAMKHDPQVVYFDAQDLADFFAFQSVHLTHGESADCALWQRREALVEDFPEITTLDQLGRRSMPIVWRAIGVPMALPGVRSIEKLSVLWSGVEVFADRGFTTGTSKVIDDLVLQDSDQPRSLRPRPSKFS